jgi:single-stranded-DNA-specific exonuclease
MRRREGVNGRSWVFTPAVAGLAESLSRAAGISRVTGQVLANRGIRDASAAKRFLQPQLDHLGDPFRLAGMKAAADRLQRALREDERIALFGDYDVDGTTGTAILARFFRLVGRDPLIRIPHRMTDGYGLNAAAVEDFAAAGAKVLVTIDCGTNDHEEIELANARGMDVIVVDHHETPTKQSAAFALVNPKADATYAFKGTCSSGIAFKLAQVLAHGLNKVSGEAYGKFILDALAFAVLGTVADVVPLVDENRALVSFGLTALEKCSNPGLRALAAKAGLDGRITSTDIAFKIAPRLNALGRLGSAQAIVDLLLSDDPARIDELIKRFESANRERKSIEDQIYEDAIQKIEADPGLLKDPVIVVADEKWHLGVVGIVAARLVDRYAKPAFVLAIDGDIAKGSGRSLDGFGLHDALEGVRECILSGGGHARAAGAGMHRSRLDEFRIRINEHARTSFGDKMPAPELAVDDEVRLEEITPALARELARLEPHGEGNRAPRLVASHVATAGRPRLMGKQQNHLSFHVVGRDGPGLRAVAFGRGEWYDSIAAARTVSLAFRPVINEWMGRESVELHVDDIKFA